MPGRRGPLQPDRGGAGGDLLPRTGKLSVQSCPILSCPVQSSHKTKHRWLFAVAGGYVYLLHTQHIMAGYMANPALGADHVAEIAKKNAEAIDAGEREQTLWEKLASWKC